MTHIAAPSTAASPVASAGASPGATGRRTLLSRVPEVTLFFWIIKILATTVGETAADYLNVNLGFGLTGVSLVMSALLIAVLVWQFSLKRYVAPVYWLAVVLISVVGTLITDNLTDNLGVPLPLSTAGFAVALAATFGAWYAKEGTLSIHSIITGRREAFYWLAILFTFALGTAAGDLIAEQLSLGYALSAGIFAAVIGLITMGHYALGINAVFSFWAAYVMTRPLGASLGDYLSQPTKDGGLGLGTTVTSFIFLAAIAAVVGFLAVTKLDREEVAVPDAA